MSAIEILIHGQQVEVIDKGEYVLMYIGGLPYKIPKHIFEKMKKSNKK